MRITFDIGVAVLWHVLSRVWGSSSSINETFGQEFVLVLKPVISILVALDKSLKYVLFRDRCSGRARWWHEQMAAVSEATPQMPARAAQRHFYSFALSDVFRVATQKEEAADDQQ